MTNEGFCNLFMEVNGLKCQINLPNAPEGKGIHNLPPYAARPVYKVDEFPACPTNWMHGSAKASSYFFPVGKGKHMWFDFNDNRSHTHHLAIVMSIQGINPITGQQSKILRLEQYREKCPVHTNEDFKQDRFCEKCDFKWPSQNYMTTVSTPGGLLWVDGWRTAAETIRGFLITAETMKGIATQVIGEDRVWAIGVAFYLSKEPKPSRPAGSGLLRSAGMSFNQSSPHKMYSYGHSGQTYSAKVPPPTNINNVAKGSSAGSMSSAGGGGTMSRNLSSPAPGSSMPMAGGYDEGTPCSFNDDFASVIPASTEITPIETEKLEIAAGAQIKQELAYHDPNDLDFYEEEPAGVLYGNYCTQNDFEKIIAAGARDMTKGGEGALAGLDVGNPL